MELDSLERISILPRYTCYSRYTKVAYNVAGVATVAMHEGSNNTCYFKYMTKYINILIKWGCNMSRSKKEIDPSVLLQLRSEGKTVKVISTYLGVSIPTLSRRIAELEHNSGLLTKYRELQGLQLSALQFRVLDAITPEKIEDASLSELVKCFGILKKAELSMTGSGRTRVTGLVQYLIEMERREEMV
jgi:DNA-binding Lrp family transcriptional regulator